jgi:hypothetical protein
MSFLAPYAFTGAVSLYLGYKTYSSYYTNLDFEEINKEDIDLIDNENAKKNEDEIKPITKEILNEERKKRGDEIKIVIDEVKDEIENLSYRTVDQIIEKALDEIEKKNPIEEAPLVEEDASEKQVVLSNEIPETVFPEVETKNISTQKKKKKKKNKKRK